MYLLFPGENMLIKEILDLLVGDVDAKLLERVAASDSHMILETENVQQSH